MVEENDSFRLMDEATAGLALLAVPALGFLVLCLERIAG
jgi:hypothetical protein